MVILHTDSISCIKLKLNKRVIKSLNIPQLSQQDCSAHCGEHLNMEATGKSSVTNTAVVLFRSNLESVVTSNVSLFKMLAFKQKIQSCEETQHTENTLAVSRWSLII